MKCIEFPAVNRWWWILVFNAAFAPAETALSTTDPTLEVHYVRTGQSLILSWASAEAVSYQIEVSSTLITWTNVSPVMTGTELPLSFTNSMIGQSRQLFRVKRVFPAAPGSAVFNPVTSLLTIVGDALHPVINVANDGAGVILVNGGAIPVTGGVATVANTVLIQVLGSTGSDQLTVGNSLPPPPICLVRQAMTSSWAGAATT